MRRAHRGFSMIEVLVALLVVAVGALGMLALQGQAMRHSVDANLRSNAVMLAEELLELMRSNRDVLFDAAGQLNGESDYFKAENVAFPSQSANCASRNRGGGGAEVARADLHCWRERVERLLPVTPAVLARQFVVCRSGPAETCSSGAGSLVMIRVAWVDERSRLCNDSVCSYVLRAEP
ncbi:type IV pilus modification protein PilV [Pseudomonas sp. JH-2]|uniref:type IV pilus modification protein PilV n=1 Tax=Pseudomonas sp. JH-2 TaxID=3114998 RepID=UPI002E2619BD|nr:type IV pilus modification protein PilV [Pseudomonas sp. JH-2]